MYIFFVIVFVMFGIKSCFCVTAGGSLQRFEKSTKRICLYLLTYLYLSMDFNLYFHRKYICIFIENIFVFLFTNREQPAAFWTKHQKDRQGGWTARVRWQWSWRLWWQWSWSWRLWWQWSWSWRLWWQWSWRLWWQWSWRLWWPWSWSWSLTVHWCWWQLSCSWFHDYHDDYDHDDYDHDDYDHDDYAHELMIMMIIDSGRVSRCAGDQECSSRPSFSASQQGHHQKCCHTNTKK